MEYKKYFTFKNIIFLILIVLFFSFIPNFLDLFMLLFTTFVLASSVEPFVKFFEKKMNRTLATFIVMVLTILATVLVLIPVFRMAIEQTYLVVESLPHRFMVLKNIVIGNGWIAAEIIDKVDLSAIAAPTADITKNILDKSLSFTVEFFNFIVFFIAFFMMMFYFIKDKNYLFDKFVEFFPLAIKDKTRAVLNDISEKVGGYVIGQILSNITIWIMVSIVLFFFKVDYPVVLGFIAGLLDIVPVLGPTIALLLILFTAYHLGFLKMGLIILLFLIIQQISNSFIKPVIFGKFLDLHPLAILVAIFICAQIFGVLGVILAPAIAATVCILVDELYLIPLNKENTNE